MKEKSTALRAPRSERREQTAASAPIRAAIYARISRDEKGQKEGVERQQKACRELADRLGWEVAEVYTDNDISAYSGKVRPEHRAMLEAVRVGQINGILTWHNDRLYRRVVELEEFISLAESTGVQVQTVMAGDFNLATAAGRMFARNLVNLAQYEIEHGRDRVRAAKQEAAAAGKYRGGPRPYGYERDGVTIRESEAQVIRDATDEILAGRSLSVVARELKERGLTTSSWKGVPFKIEKRSEWTYSRLRDVLIRPRNAGLLSTGRADRGEHQILGDATWPAIISREKFDALTRILLDPSRRIHQNTLARWIGSNTYICGIEGCGAPMKCSASTDKRAGKVYRRYYYRCTAASHLSIHADKTDDFVRGVLVEKLKDPSVIRAMTANDVDATKADRERRADLVLRIETTEAEYDDDLIDVHTRNRKVGKAEAEIADIDQRLADAAQQSATASVFNAPDPAAEFLKRPVDVQRAVLRQAVRVTVLPVRRGEKWSPKRLRFDPLT